MKKSGGLKRRWFRNTVVAAGVLALACVLGVTAVFASFRYSDLEMELRSAAKNTAALLENGSALIDSSQLDVCISSVDALDSGSRWIVQFVLPDGTVSASTVDVAVDAILDTADVQESVISRGSPTFFGEDPILKERVMAVSAPVIDYSGQVTGVIRILYPLHQVETQVLMVAFVAAVVLLLICTVVLIISNYYIRSILTPIADITDKTRRIAGGTYGIQITSVYDDELGQLVQTINDMSAQIAQNEKTQTEFISSLSHELRTPLTAITGWSETLLGEESLDQEQQRGMKIILREARRLTEMVVDLLDFTRIQGGKMTLNMEQTDIRSEFEDTVFMYGSRLAQDGIQLNYIENEDDIPDISCDPKRLRQVFLNILDNAAKHGGDGKTVDASISYEDEQVIVQIRDYGPGIPEDEIPLVKKKFYKGSSKARGSGIGLAVSDEIVEMHGGQLVLENAPGGGTLVTVALPAVQ